MLIDTHAHLDDPRFAGEVESLLARARVFGVNRTITIGVDLATSREAVELAREHPEDLSAAVGLSPFDADVYDSDYAQALESLAQQPGVVAWGEIGLEYHHDCASHEVQRNVFLDQLRRARRLGLPVIIHDRDAHEDILKCLRQAEDYPAFREPPYGVMHCFSGDLEMAKQVIDLGYLISIAGVVTFKNARDYQDIVSQLPLESLVVETDSPWLTPHPHRGKRNEPSYVRFTARKVAELQKVELNELARVTTANARQLFNLPQNEGHGGEIVYPLNDNLYLNLTSRCNNNCTFCVRRSKLGLGGYRLWLDREPTAEELIAAIGNPVNYNEVVFCGFGEPLLRPATAIAVAGWLREQGASVRIDTNGSAHRTLGLPVEELVNLLQPVVNRLSVSLNADDEESYAKLCLPREGEAAFGAVKEFVQTAVKAGIPVTCTAVALPELDVSAIEALARSWGADFRVRSYKP